MLTINVDQTGTWTVAGDFTIHNLSQLENNIDQWLGGESPVTINLEQVTHVDTAALQFLVSFKKYLKWKNRPFKIEADGPVLKAMELLGLKKHLVGE